jgi:hypothetical protein
VNVAWSPTAAAAIGADWLLEAIAPAGTFGRRERAGERAFRPGDEAGAQSALARVAAAAQSVAPQTLARLSAALAGAPDPRTAAARACAGDVLGDDDFFEIARFLEALSEMCDGAADPAFAHVCVPGPDETLRAALGPGRVPSRAFYLADAFAPELAAARGVAAARQEAFDAARGRIAARVGAALRLEVPPDGEFIVMRDEHAGPIPPDVHVVREAPTYLLCELALDDDGVAALGARDAAAARVAEAEERVRTALSATVRAAADALEDACERLGALDCFVARARFAQRYGAIAPEITSGAHLEFRAARYLPLAENLQRHGRAYAPISLDLEGAGVVTGPNMGGKTAALRTCGFVAACVALGVPVPAEAARVPLFDEIVWLGGETQSQGAARESLLSAFGAEVVTLCEFLERKSPRALVLLDEFARTTSPEEGRALLVAVLGRLAESGACAFAATHFAHVARAAGVAGYAVVGLRDVPQSGGAPLPLDAALERIAAAMDYEIHRADGAEAARADALALAEVLGLEPALVARARAALAAGDAPRRV